MRGQHLTAIVVVLIAVAAYFLGRQASTIAAPSSVAAEGFSATETRAANGNQPQAGRKTDAARAARQLPPPGVPLKDLFSDLQARADAGDIAAATRLYRDLGMCRRLDNLELGNSQLADDLLGQALDAMDAEQLKNYRAQLDAIESRKHNMDRLHTLCDGVSEAMLDSLVRNLQRAAQLGETYARACYLDRGPNFDLRGFLGHPEMLGSYRRSAGTMIEAGIAAGDWQVVNLLRAAYEPGAQNLLSAVVGKEPDQYYRHLKLFHLGAESDRGGQLDRDLAGAAAKLTPTQRAEADAWAQATFRNNFRSRPLDADGPLWDPCVFPYE